MMDWTVHVHVTYLGLRADLAECSAGWFLRSSSIFLVPERTIIDDDLDESVQRVLGMIAERALPFRLDRGSALHVPRAVFVVRRGLGSILSGFGCRNTLHGFTHDGTHELSWYKTTMLCDGCTFTDEAENVNSVVTAKIAFIGGANRAKRITTDRLLEAHLERFRAEVEIEENQK